MGGPRLGLTVVLVSCALSSLLPVTAGAYATIGPAPEQSGSSGLPDGRVYEQVSPTNKHGYEAGAIPRDTSTPFLFGVRVAFAAPSGNAITYRANGPLAETNAGGLSEDFVAERTISGWKSRSSVGRPIGLNELGSFHDAPLWSDYSSDLSRLAYVVEDGEVLAAPRRGNSNVYLRGSQPLEESTWLMQSVASSVDENQQNIALLGMTSDASAVYFAYEGRLLPQDASRSGWGLYESRDGVVSEFGLLPDGSVPAQGALPAATTTDPDLVGSGQTNPASFDNQVSEDGTRVFFVSSGQLYVHKLETDGSEHSVLVSASQRPGHVGEPAPDGVTLFENTSRTTGGSFTELSTLKSGPTYAYASGDGSHVFFQSSDQLTSGAPGGAGLKVYDFDVGTGRLEYLPGVVLGGIVTASKDGSSLLFVNDSALQPDLDRWVAGVGGGSVTQIIHLPEGGFVGPARMVDGDSVIVFQARGPIIGVSHSTDEQIYRYETQSNELDCVSCPPGQVDHSGNSYLSVVDNYALTVSLNEVRGVSGDGRQIFFGSPNPLVSRDTNGDFDAYEWEDGKVFLISPGVGSGYSAFLDNGESGGDIFFVTPEGLAAGDDDEGFDLYDARIPRPGDNPAPSAVPCTGDVCQGPPSAPQLLGPPASSTFDGIEAVAEDLTATKASSGSSARSSAKGLTKALSKCRKQKPKKRRLACERQVRKRVHATRAQAKPISGRGK